MPEPRTAEQHRYETIEGTVWPIPDQDEWVLRYGLVEMREAIRMHTASIVAAYSSLLDPNRTQADAVAMLKRGRAALASAGDPDA